MTRRSLLSTKLYIPPTRPELVQRARLVERLDSGLHRKLTVISAPAGFGKTTLVTEWLDKLRGDAQTENQVENQIAWLSLDEGDNDPTRFLTYFITALNQIEGKDACIGEGALNLLQSAQPQQSEAVLTQLINEIAGSTGSAIPDRILLVLDDYHLIEAQPIHDALSFTLENMPPQMHLVIATREDPHLPLSRLRARGQLTELRATDLRFSIPEAAEFLNRVMGLNLPAEDIRALETRTEGWITGLQLAAISMRGSQDTDGFIKSFTGSHRYVLDYLIEEVLDQQPESTQTFLLQTSVLQRLSGALCDALTGQDHSQQTLEILERTNLFIIPLDDERRWYRYHHLFAGLLKQRLRQIQPEQLPILHIKASKWYEQEDLPSDAIRHALAAEDFKRAADLAELFWPTWSGPVQSISWLGWVKRLPDELVRDRPVLCVAYAQALLNAGDLEAAEARLLDAERWFEPTNERPEVRPVKMVVVDEAQLQSLPASLATSRAYHAQAVGNVSGTVKYAQQVLEIAADGDHQRRGDATALLGLAYWAGGDLEAAHRTLSVGLADMDPLDVIVGTFVLADMKKTLGQLYAAVSTCEHALQLAMEYGEPFPLGTEDVYTGISELHLELVDLEAAVQDLQTAKKLGEQIELPDWQYRWCIAQARLNETLGDLEGALVYLSEAERLYVRTPLPIVRPIAAMRTRVWVRQNRLTEAMSWARQRGLSVDDDLSYLREFEHITLARVLIVQYKRDQVDETVQDAIGLLARLLKAAEEGGRIGSVIEILALQAIAQEAQGDISSATTSLEHALKLAEPQGYVRIFVDEGPPMEKLLNVAVKRGIQTEYSSKLLAAFKNIKEVENSQQNQQLIEPLSARELDVLQLVAQGLSNRQIGERLFLALDTVKGYNRKIYGKLEVKNRAEAVNKAISLKILPPQ